MQHDRHLSNGCVLLRASTGPRACATGGLSLLSSHQLDKKAQRLGPRVVCSCSGDFSRKAAWWAPKCSHPSAAPVATSDLK